MKKTSISLIGKRLWKIDSNDNLITTIDNKGYYEKLPAGIMTELVINRLRWIKPAQLEDHLRHWFEDNFIIRLKKS